MASGMAGKRTESFVPKMTSWRLVNKSLSIPHLTFDTRVRSDFLRNDEDDMLCAVLPCLISLLEPLRLPFSKSHGSCNEAMLGLQQNQWSISLNCKKVKQDSGVCSSVSLCSKGLKDTVINRRWKYDYFCMHIYCTFQEISYFVLIHVRRRG